MSGGNVTPDSAAYKSRNAAGSLKRKENTLDLYLLFTPIPLVYYKTTAPAIPAGSGAA
jgi:hypothetical protein